ncbi:hypothetical protein FOZ63_020364 [Perkinsus olseni]|uniref:Uncharacterized protein n=1 Tax=Perkinsus olseni TaxID=32597 RepID=A0A7J6QWZ3_PEROL|nr:hypothetical protein FOZ63_020364 [Perkinsus olseni]
MRKRRWPKKWKSSLTTRLMLVVGLLGMVLLLSTYWQSIHHPSLGRDDPHLELGGKKEADDGDRRMQASSRGATRRHPFSPTGHLYQDVPEELPITIHFRREPLCLLKAKAACHCARPQFAHECVGAWTEARGLIRDSVNDTLYRAGLAQRALANTLPDEVFVHQRCAWETLLLHGTTTGSPMRFFVRAWAICSKSMHLRVSS